MAMSDGPEPTYALPEGFKDSDVFITVDPGYPCCVDQPNKSVPPGAAVRWRSVEGREFQIRFSGGAPCSNWSSEWRTSKNGVLVCAIPPDSSSGGYKYDVKIGDCECDPIIWVQ